MENDPKLIQVTQLENVLEENRQLKTCLRTFLKKLIICDRDGGAHVDNDLVRTSMKLCDMDERLINFTEE